MYRTGIGIDYHRLAEGPKLFIGGVDIPHHKGSVGHSDADVLLHAICDAMLGALSLGDIGKHFPNTDPQFKNIDSKKLLQRCFELISERGYAVVNVDGTVCLENPKIMPFASSMRTVIANLLNISEEAVSIKATTTEELGFAGREEGLFAQAVVLLKRNELIIRIQNKGKNELPKYATQGSSGLDIRASIEQPVLLKPMDRQLVPTGLFLEIPEGFEGQVRPRSGMAINYGVTCLNTPGTIDADYRGELKVILINLGESDFEVKDGDRIAQLVFSPIVKAQLEVALINKTKRGAGGFGHTGTT